MVFPLPVGAPTNTLSSLLYTALNTGVTEKENYVKKRLYIESRGTATSLITDRPTDCLVCFCTLCLNGVEEGELVLVESLKGRVPESSDGQRLQVQQFGGWRVLLWQDQVPERHWQLSLTG